MDQDKKLWKKCAEFHGHECGGLTIGYKAALYVAELLELSGGEPVVCIAENNACSIDAIRVILGCSEADGSLRFRLTNRQVYSFLNRATGKAVRLALRDRPEGVTREQSFAYYQALDPKDMFEVSPVEPGCDFAS